MAEATVNETTTTITSMYQTTERHVDAMRLSSYDFNTSTTFNTSNNKKQIVKLTDFDNEKKYLEIEKKVFDIYNSKNIWDDCSVESPNEVSINNTLEILAQLYVFSFFNLVVLPSVEGGMMLKIKNKDSIMYFELYNDGDLGYIIEDLKVKKIVKNEDLNSVGDSINVILDFLSW